MLAVAAAAKEVLHAVWPPWSPDDLADAQSIEEAFKRHVDRDNVPSVLKSETNKDGKMGVPHIADIGFLCQSTLHGPFRVPVCKILKRISDWSLNSTRNRGGYRPYSLPVHFFLADLCDFLVQVSGFIGQPEQVEVISKRLAYIDLVERVAHNVDSRLRNTANRMGKDSLEERQFFRGLLFFAQQSLEDLRDQISAVVKVRGSEEMLGSLSRRLIRVISLGATCLHLVTSMLPNARSIQVICCEGKLFEHEVLRRLWKDDHVREILSDSLGLDGVMLETRSATIAGSGGGADVLSFISDGPQAVERVMTALKALACRSDDIQLAIESAKLGGDLFVYHLHFGWRDSLDLMRGETEELVRCVRDLHSLCRSVYNDPKRGRTVWDANYAKTPFRELISLISGVEREMGSLARSAQSVTFEQRWRALCSSVDDLREIARIFSTNVREQHEQRARLKVRAVEAAKKSEVQVLEAVPPKDDADLLAGKMAELTKKKLDRKQKMQQQQEQPLQTQEITKTAATVVASPPPSAPTASSFSFFSDFNPFARIQQPFQTQETAKVAATVVASPPPSAPTASSIGFFSDFNPFGLIQEMLQCSVCRVFTWSTFACGVCGALVCVDHAAICNHRAICSNCKLVSSCTTCATSFSF
jgi:hypothetical protein